MFVCWLFDEQHPQYSWDFPEEIQKGPSRTKSTSAKQNIVNYYAVRSYYAPHVYYAVRTLPLEETCPPVKPSTGVVMIANHYVVNSLWLYGVHVLCAAFLVRLGPVGSGKFGKTLEMLTELFLKFLSRVRLGTPQTLYFKTFEGSRASPEFSPPSILLWTSLFPEVVPEGASQSCSCNCQQY